MPNALKTLGGGEAHGGSDRGRGALRLPAWRLQARQFDPSRSMLSARGLQTGTRLGVVGCCTLLLSFTASVSASADECKSRSANSELQTDPYGERNTEQALGDGGGLVVTSLPDELTLPKFYRKYVSAGGYPVVSSENVNDYALKEAAYLINMMLAKRPDVRQAMIKSGSRMIVMAHDELTTDIPEHSRLRPKDYWDARARGLGGSRTDPVCSCAEENLLGFADDPYSTENILIHEFAHNIHLRGMVNVDPTFDDRLKQVYKRAMSAGLWKGKYASVNYAEYFAEGVQSWFDNNRPPDHDHNHVDTRRELREYDPGLAAICKEVFRDTKLVYTKPATRLIGHLAGYDPQKAPRFTWPQHLKKIKREIRLKAKQRDGVRNKPYTK